MASSPAPIPHSNADHSDSSPLMLTGFASCAIVRIHYRLPPARLTCGRRHSFCPCLRSLGHSANHSSPCSVLCAHDLHPPARFASLCSFLSSKVDLVAPILVQEVLRNVFDVIAGGCLIPRPRILKLALFPSVMLSFKSPLNTLLWLSGSRTMMP